MTRHIWLKKYLFLCRASIDSMHVAKAHSAQAAIKMPDPKFGKMLLKCFMKRIGQILVGSKGCAHAIWEGHGHLQSRGQDCWQGGFACGWAGMKRSTSSIFDWVAATIRRGHIVDLYQQHAVYTDARQDSWLMRRLYSMLARPVLRCHHVVVIPACNVSRGVRICQFCCRVEKVSPCLTSALWSSMMIWLSSSHLRLQLILLASILYTQVNSSNYQEQNINSTDWRKGPPFQSWPFLS